ncbi:four-carbon acid sugar kinase family protein [Devosia algicola]|uniref:Four-carbon acid sugar kinase family protein n=1 Tax=Devosia algicola TaxID=3026418 RepID=A0ABY7YLK0_9HYPH|nr:four-carbon acid sugar kinase family protein [Devosia algicola]WDR02180.1 four-carbon acid sugar kinase family protein [Devosia algicola]
MAKLQVLLIADDLTGALDAGAPFSDLGFRTLMVPQWDALIDPTLEVPQIACVSTSTRELGKPAAVARVEEIARALRHLQPTLVFKKIDSRLKGSAAAESRAVMTVFNRQHMIVAPAIPDMGRTIVDGYLSGHGLDTPIDVRSLFGPHSDVTVCDAVDRDGLTIAAETVMTRPTECVAVGARGLAVALAQQLLKAGIKPVVKRRRMETSVARPILLVIGSRDEVTQRQIAHLRSSRTIQLIFAPNGLVPVGKMNSQTCLLVATATDELETPEVVGRRFARGVAQTVVQNKPATLLMSGGETAASVLAALGVKSLEVAGEIFPGVSRSHATISGLPTTIFTKSGGFGDPDTLSRLVAMTGG